MSKNSDESQYPEGSAGESRERRISRTIAELSERLRKEYGVSPVIYSSPERGYKSHSYLESTFRMRFRITGEPAQAFAMFDPQGNNLYRYQYLGGYWEWANHFTPRVTGSVDWDGWVPDESV